MAKMKKAKLFTIETEVFLEQDLLDIRLDSNTIITLIDGRYTSFKRASEYVKLTASGPTVDEELALALQGLLHGILRKIVNEIKVAQKTEIGAEWKK